MKTKPHNRTIHQSLYGIVLIMLMFVVSSSYAEEIDKAPAKWSLQFGIERDFQLGGFDGMQISIRKHCSALRAWRLGARLVWSIRNNDRHVSGDDEESYSHYEEDASDFRFDVSFLHEWHPVKSKSIGMIIGLGPELGLGVTGRENSQLSGYPEGVRTNETDSKSYHAGLRSVLGVEWFVARQISLMAEHKLSIAYSYESRESTSEDPVRITKSSDIRRSFSLLVNSLNFGVSVYF